LKVVSSIQSQPQTGLKLFNTMTRKKEFFKPLKDNSVKIFTCGPSIHQPVHLGNFKIFLFEDILIRYLEYLGYKVEHVMNLTDIEDEVVFESKKKGIDIKTIIDSVAKTFTKESALLKLKPSTYNPWASDNKDQAVKLIKILLKKGIAYRHKGDVYFDPSKFPNFGKLYGLDMNLWPKKKKRFKKDNYSGLRWNLGDFILWHSCRDGERIFWDEDLGYGRPSWNIQDPAMATKYLGFEIDICCGCSDNLFRHHDYHLAIAEGVSGKTFATYWLHAKDLYVYGKKISKSTGNIVHLGDLLKDGYEPEHVRFYLIYSHYQEKINFTKKDFENTVKKLNELRELVKELMEPDSCGGKSDMNANSLIEELVPKFEECMNNDLDVKYAIDEIFETVSKLISFKRENRLTTIDSNRALTELRKIDEVFQIIFNK